MIKINALNDDPPIATNEGNVLVSATKEALEEAAFVVYRKALKHLQQSRNAKAEKALNRLLLIDFVKESVPRSDGNDIPLTPGLTLKYLAYKNLASIASERGDYKAAMEAYLEAVNIDMTDVNVWSKMGFIAQKLENFPLARLCFEEGLKCNPNHWLCLDKIITLTYSFNDYTSCLHYISRALQKHYSYVKGLAFRDQIYKDHPMLRLDSDKLFRECDPRVYSFVYNKADAEKLIKEALQIREKKYELSKPKPLPVLAFTKPLEEHTWKAVGESLNTLYDYIRNADPSISLACKVDLKARFENKRNEAVCDKMKASDTPPQELSSSDGSSAESESPITSGPTSQSQDDLKKDVLLLMEVEETEKRATSGELVESILTSEISSVNQAAIHSKGKRKRMMFDAYDPNWKRRSARVRNTGIKKVEDSTNYRELLRKFLPSSLLGEGREDDQDDNDDPMALQIDIPSCDHTYGQSVPCRHEEKQQLPESVEYLTTTEAEDVKTFIEGNLVNAGILELYQNYLLSLSQKSHLVWPNGLIDLYLEAFQRWRNHVTQPSIFCQEASDEKIYRQGWITLVYHELRIDKWQSKSRLSSVSPSLSNARSGPGGVIGLGSDFPGNFFYEDSDFLLHLTVRRDIFKENAVEYIVRSFWQRAKFHILEGDNVMAVKSIDKVAFILSQNEDDTPKEFKIYLVNCFFNNVIALAQVQEKLESLQRCQSLEEVHRLYDQGEYQRVVDLLILTFTQPQTKTKALEDRNVPERHYQLLLLQDSLWKLEVFKDFLYWGEAAFNEAVQQYVASASSTTTRDWAHTTTHLLNGLDKCLSKDEALLAGLASGKLIRLTNNLIRVISLQMNSTDFNSDTNISTLAPWILLYRLIHHEENKILSLAGRSLTKGRYMPKDIDSSDDSEPSSIGENALSTALPSSLMLLFTAHEYLGRKPWCTCCEGSFLHLSIDVMMSELKLLSNHAEDLKIGIEQCFYCLYGHPNKRTKVKHIMEHNANPVSLQWMRAQQLFEYFQPEVLPEFDSYKTSTIATELENLLKRISHLVPPEEDPTHSTENVVAYIEGGTVKCPDVPKNNASLVVREIYYLLGDYYFKNKEFGKACKFYILDVVVNPDRLDSWAGMALSRSSQLEQKLTSSDLKNDTTVYRKSCSALRSFRRALELDSKRITLWIEYGSMAYMLHAYASRQLKQQSQLNFTDDIIDLLNNKREEMLSTAENCFRSANQCYEDSEEPAEVWLHHYMLGKIAEKRQENPNVFLQHYRLAADHLYLEAAKYPKRILYHNPPELSVESVECYYRSHTSILKYLMKKETEQPSKEILIELSKFIKILEDSPFANFQELREQELIQSSEDEEVVPKKIAKKRTSNSTTDHDYINKNHKSSHSLNRRNQRELHADSSSESDNSAAIKDVLNSLIIEVSERCSKQSSKSNQPIVVLGDEKLKRKVSRSSPLPVQIKESETASSGNNKRKPKSFMKLNSTIEAELEVARISQQPIEVTFDELTQKCLAAIFECQQRFSQHYKSLYRLAHYYCYSSLNKNLQKSRDILLGGSNAGQIPSLFGERKNANFFNGIWRIPIDEIERPGSFTSHMFRSIVLVVDVLRQLGDYNMLAQLTITLNRTPDLGKKYLRDTDRLHLSREAFTLCLGVLRETMNGLLLEEPPPEESRLVACLLDIYRTWQMYQKSGVYPDEANDLLEEAYSMYKLGEVDPSPPVLEQAIRFCQSYKTQDSPRGSLIRSASVPNDYSSAQIIPGAPIQNTGYEVKGKKIPTQESIVPQAEVQMAGFRPVFPILNQGLSPGQEEFTKWYYQLLLSNTASATGS